MSTQATAAPDTKRDANGRFGVGNGGGPGNPQGPRVAALRSALLEEVKPEDLQAITRTLIDLAKDGNLQAAKLVLAYTLGKPESSFAAAIVEAAATPTVPVEEVLSSLLASAPPTEVGRKTPPSPNGILDDLREHRIVPPLPASGPKKAPERR